MTADRPAVTGPVPAPESTHTPGPVFRDRGVIIHTLITENERLKTELDQEKAETERVWGDFKALAEQVADAHRRDAAVRALADEWDAAVDARGGTTLAPVRFLARDLRAALAGAPAVTPTETQAEGGAHPFCVCDHDQRSHSLGAGVCQMDVHETGAPCGCLKFWESALSRQFNRPAPVADPTTGETR